MHGRTHKRMDARADGRMDGRVNERANEQGDWTSAHLDERTAELTDRWTDARMDGQTSEHTIDEETNGRMDSCADGHVDYQQDNHKGKEVKNHMASLPTFFPNSGSHNLLKQQRCSAYCCSFMDGPREMVTAAFESSPMRTELYQTRYEHKTN